jgi:hypothetical protein
MTKMPSKFKIIQKKKKLEKHFRKNGSGQLGALHGIPHARPSCQEHCARVKVTTSKSLPKSLALFTLKMSYVLSKSLQAFFNDGQPNNTVSAPHQHKRHVQPEETKSASNWDQHATRSLDLGKVADLLLPLDADPKMLTSTNYQNR